MNVIALHRIMNQTKTKPLSSRFESIADRLEHALAPRVPNTARQPQRHQHRMMLRQRRPSDMLRILPALPPRPNASTTTTKRERPLLHRLNSANISRPMAGSTKKKEKNDPKDS